MGWWQNYKGWVAGNFRLMGRAFSLTTSSFMARAFIIALQLTIGMLCLIFGLIVFFFALVIGIIRERKRKGKESRAR
jgi:uncharacterized membrane protein